MCGGARLLSVYVRRPAKHVDPADLEYQGCLHIDNISSSTPVRALTIDQIKQNSIEAGFLGKKVEENDTCKEANPFDNNQFAKSDVSITQWTNVWIEGYTATMCAHRCRSFLKGDSGFIAIGEHGSCWCVPDNELKNVEYDNDGTRCDAVCPSASVFECGGNDAFSIYKFAAESGFWQRVLGR